VAVGLCHTLVHSHDDVTPNKHTTGQTVCEPRARQHTALRRARPTQSSDTAATACTRPRGAVARLSMPPVCDKTAVQHARITAPTQPHPLPACLPACLPETGRRRASASAPPSAALQPVLGLAAATPAAPCPSSHPSTACPKSPSERQTGAPCAYQPCAHPACTHTHTHRPPASRVTHKLLPLPAA
jgi:hypothetical protein